MHDEELAAGTVHSLDIADIIAVSRHGDNATAMEKVIHEAIGTESSTHCRLIGKCEFENPTSMPFSYVK